MFNFINHNSFKIYFIISILIVNLSILFLNKNKFFYYYKKEINFFAFESDISKFNQHQFTILNYITEQLGNEYKFRNFRIVGPNFTKIHMGIKKFKNEKKTDYIRSKHLLSFSISSSSQKTINDVTNSIMISYPTIMEYLNSIDFLNYFNLTNERIQIICYNILIKKIDEVQTCDEIRNIFFNINNRFESIALENLAINTFLNKNENLIKDIKSDFSNIKNLFRELNKTKESLPILYNETLELLLKSDDIDTEFIKKRNHSKFKMFSNPLSEKEFQANHINKAFVYANLLLLMFFFALSYFKLTMSKKNENVF